MRKALTFLFLTAGCATSAPPPEPEPDPEAETLKALPEDTPPRVRQLVELGDRHYRQAMRHLRASDPTVNAEGWAAENKAALDSFQKANKDAYLPAQDEYGSGQQIPQNLLDRVRETALRAALCRKRAVSSRK